LPPPGGFFHKLRLMSRHSPRQGAFLRQKIRRRKNNKNQRGVSMNTPKSITNEEAAQLIYWLDNRFKVIFELACQSGLRISDILSLKVKDLYNPMTVYERKSRRKRTFAISNELYNNLRYLADYKSGDDYVFESHAKRGVSLHRSTIHRHIKKALFWSDFDASAHSARKLYAVNVMDATGSVEKVRQALNHRKTSTTLAYLKNVRQDSGKHIKTATDNPRGNIFAGIFSFIKRIFRKGVKP
jgi:integrase